VRLGGTSRPYGLGKKQTARKNTLRSRAKGGFHNAHEKPQHTPALEKYTPPTQAEKSRTARVTFSEPANNPGQKTQLLLTFHTLMQKKKRGFFYSERKKAPRVYLLHWEFTRLGGGSCRVVGEWYCQMGIGGANLCFTWEKPSPSTSGSGKKGGKGMFFRLLFFNQEPRKRGEKGREQLRKKSSGGARFF